MPNPTPPAPSARTRSVRRATRALAVGLLLYAAAAFAAPRVLVFGDSLSAGFGLEERQGWVHLLQQRLAAAGWETVNASISGETTDGGRARLPGLLAREKPAVVILELGGNDGLRALPLTGIRANLRAMIAAARAADARVVLVAMRIPPNYGPAYTRGFERIYPQLARELQVPLTPFLLQGVAEDATLMQSDGIHAAAAAQPRLLENVWGTLKPLLGSRGEGRGARNEENQQRLPHSSQVP